MGPRRLFDLEEVALPNSDRARRQGSVGSQVTVAEVRLQRRRCAAPDYLVRRVSSWCRVLRDMVWPQLVRSEQTERDGGLGDGRQRTGEGVCL